MPQPRVAYQSMMIAKVLKLAYSEVTMHARSTATRTSEEAGVYVHHIVR